MRLALVALTAVTLAGCAHTPSPEAPPPVCRSGFAPLRFTDGAAALAPGFARALGWPAEAATACPETRMIVHGLPSPDPTGSLAARRAASVAAVLKGFGIPQPVFELGDAETQAHPRLELIAGPD